MSYICTKTRWRISLCKAVVFFTLTLTTHSPPIHEFTHTRICIWANPRGVINAEILGISTMTACCGTASIAMSVQQIKPQEWGALLNKSRKGQYRLLTSPWSFKGFTPLFFSPFCFLPAQQGEESAQCVSKLGSLKANATSLGGIFVVPHEGNFRIPSQISAERDPERIRP